MGRATAVVSSQMVGLSTSDRRDEGGHHLYVPYSLSEGRGRPRDLSGHQGGKRQGGKRQGGLIHVLYTKRNHCCSKPLNNTKN